MCGISVTVKYHVKKMIERGEVVTFTHKNIIKHVCLGLSKIKCDNLTAYASNVSMIFFNGGGGIYNF